jgi:pSer/pThr/pTyr-binding forkhead associated (FHA) protein
MAKLVLSSGGSIVFQCFLDQEPLSVGRAAQNQVVVDDAAVSEEHAVIVPVGNDHILEDLQSANGTLVNGTRVARHLLQHGDVMQFGAFYLRYLNPRASAERDLERTMLIEGLHARGDDARPASLPPEEGARVPSARRPPVHFPKGRVRVIAGSRAGSTIELDRVVATFGRPGEQLAVITRRPQGYFITHVEGRRYPRVNRETLGKAAQALRPGDVIDVAGETLEFLQD